MVLPHLLSRGLRSRNASANTSPDRSRSASPRPAIDPSLVLKIYIIKVQFPFFFFRVLSQFGAAGY